MTAIATGVDIYGSDAAKFVGVKANKTTAAAASGTIGSAADTNGVNSAFSWVAFILLLVFIRILEEFSPTV